MFNFEDKETVLPLLKEQEKTVKDILPSFLQHEGPSPVALFNDYIKTGDEMFKHAAGAAMKSLESVGKTVGNIFSSTEKAVVKPEMLRTNVAAAPILNKTATYKPFTVDEAPTFTTPNGLSGRQVPQQLASTIADAYAKYPSLPRGVLETAILQESSMGTNPANYNPSIGKYAWLVGFTNIAKDELTRARQAVDLDTPEGAVAAMARYLSLKQKIKDKDGKVTEQIDDPYELYSTRYKTSAGHPLSHQQEKQFRKLVAYYAGTQ